MNSVSRAPIGNLAKVLLIAFVLIGAWRMLEFVLRGQQITSALSGIGFALMAYGVYKNGLGPVAAHRGGRWASIVGIALALASIAIRYLA